MIEKVSCINLSSPYGDGNIFGSPSGLKSVSVIEIVDQNGVKGYGEAYSGVYAPTIVKHYIDLIGDDLIGMPIEVSERFHRITNKHCISMSGVVKSIVGAIEIALFDVLAKRQGKSLYKFLFRDNNRESIPLKCYYSGGSAVLSPDQITQDVERAIGLGHNAYKMRVGLQENDAERVGSARQSLGDRNLMCDAIQSTLHSWSLGESISNLKKMSGYNLFWAEEFVDPSDPADVFRLRAECPDANLAFGESFTTLNEFYSLSQLNCLDVAQPDVSQCGGIRTAIKICLSLEGKCDKVAFHVWGGPVAIAANLHLAMAMQSCFPGAEIWFEVPAVCLQLTEDLLSLRIENGYVGSIEDLGLGVEITDEIKDKYRFVEDSSFKDTRE